jgi:CubicO group peptidase (beta-lactamase class C family)
VLDQELAPDTPLLAMVRPLLKFEVDETERTVTASVGNARATAAFVEGLGCVLLRDLDLAAARARALPGRKGGRDAQQVDWPDGERLPEQPWPEGVDRKALEAAVAQAFAERQGRPPSRTRAVVVVHQGRLLLERYAEGFHARMALPGWSMTKSVTCTLLGIRVAQDRLDPEAPLPVRAWSGAEDPRRALRLPHLLTMQSGLQWREAEDDAAGDVVRMLFLERSAAGFAADRPLAQQPGSTFVYSSGTTNILCDALRATFANDADYLAFPRKALFDRIGMRSALIGTDPAGTFVGSSLGFATARDWARLGLLWQQRGSWHGVQIVPADWIAASLQPAPHADHGRFGQHVWLNAGDGEAADHRSFDRLPSSAFFFEGYEGQYVAVLPAQQLVIVRLGCAKRGGFDLHGFLAAVAAACPAR